MKTSIILLLALTALRLNSQTTTNLPPVLVCPADTTVECKTPAQVSVLISDPEGDALTVHWTLNGKAVQTNSVAASIPPTPTNLSFSAVLPLGTNLVTVSATDTATNSASCASKVIVVDTTPPIIAAASASPNVLWPPNHKLVNVTLTAHVTDVCSTASWKITHVDSNEGPVAPKGSGKTSPEWQITGNHTLKLLADRSGAGNGRIYSITILATNAAGNVSQPTVVTVRVPHDQSKGK
jgi:hypothetical protein